MRLPGGERALIDPEKLRDYVLSRAHPVGRFKAAFFASLGYEIDTWHDLDRACGSGRSSRSEAEDRTTYGRNIAFGVSWRGEQDARSNCLGLDHPHDETTPRLVTVTPGR